MTTDFNPFTALFTTSELSLSRALNSLLPPSVRAAEIPSFKPKSELGPDDHHSDGEGGSMISLKLFNVTHLPPREIVKRLATTLNSTLGITFFIVEPPAEVENLVDRVYSHCDHYNLARRQQRAYGLSMAAMKLPQPPSTCEICEILAMAAVGSQYDRQASASLRQACFHSARFGLDDAIEEAEEADAGDEVHYRVLRLLILLAIYQILEKRGSCWRYIGTSL
ncbi:hypothetical protein L211DRAFT_841314 [Terfezia boudieri ATCC MYA-4762]|uniref:Uncharacterized protein n=1 Tax=Terfezia boudieri ATCC MYA-4762 TaxID=1051890 RepID=A0A3N4LJI5_9PEZI|nr:hypothetical protein L211DRAFT_841314 [Terfezia boudieri ATCC MYA-4762]